MKDDWLGSELAWRTLRRCAAGLPLFPWPARHPVQARSRRAALAWLYEQGFIERAAKLGGRPQLTELGRAELSPRPRENLWTAADYATVRKLAGVVPASAIAERVGRTPGAVYAGLYRRGYRARKRGADAPAP